MQIAILLEWDTKTFIDNIKRKQIYPQIDSFNGITSGNGAGAHILCQEYLKILYGGSGDYSSNGISSFSY